MKNLFFIPFLYISFYAMAQDAGNTKIAKENQFLVDTWTGKGRFHSSSLHKTTGNINFDIEIEKDGKLDVKIGDANLIDPKIRKANYGFEIKGKLDKRIHPGIDLDKQKLIILLVMPENPQSGLQTIKGNFHLKSNYFFDFSMRVGGMTLERE